MEKKNKKRGGLVVQLFYKKKEKRTKDTKQGLNNGETDRSLAAKQKQPEALTSCSHHAHVPNRKKKRKKISKKE
jgi:hypothetical protein